MFKDREDAGRRLTSAVEKLNLGDPTVYALQRIGVQLSHLAGEGI